MQGTLDLERAIAVTSTAYQQFAAGHVVPFPPQTLGGTADAIRVSGGILASEDGVGVRLSKTGYGESIAILYGIDPPAVLSIISFSSYGTMRTAALMGVATERLAPTESATLAMIGTGRNAPDYLRVACLLRPIKKIKVFSRHQASREQFAAGMASELQRPVEAVDSCEAATSDADIVFVSTNSPEAVIEAESLPPGVFLASMGRPRELGSSVYLAAERIIVPKRPKLEHVDAELEQSQLEELARKKEVDWNGKVLELGVLLNTVEPPSRRGEGATVFREFQTGFGDVALCIEIYRQCVSQGLGTELSL